MRNIASKYMTMDTRLWLYPQFWDFVKEFENKFKYDRSVKLTVFYTGTCSRYPRFVSFRKVGNLLRFLERISCDLFDEFTIISMRFGGRYTPSQGLVKDGKFL